MKKKIKEYIDALCDEYGMDDNKQAKKMLVNDFGFVLSNEQKEQIRSCKNNFKIDRLARDIIFKKLK